MKKKVVRLIKGDSLIYVIFGERSDGHGYSVALGGNCGIHDHETKSAAEAEFKMRIGHLVANGYKAELCKTTGAAE